MCEVTEKTCGHCKETKPFSLFYKNKAKKDGYANYCKPCANKAGRDSEKRHPETLRKNKKRKNLRDRAYKSEWQKKKVYSLNDGYIKQRICQNTSLKFNEVPQELIECKRIQLQIKRHIKGLNK